MVMYIKSVALFRYIELQYSEWVLMMIVTAATVVTPKTSGHHRWVLSVAVGVSCTFVISVMLLVCCVHWYRSRLLFTSYGNF